MCCNTHRKGDDSEILDNILSLKCGDERCLPGDSGQETQREKRCHHTKSTDYERKRQNTDGRPCVTSADRTEHLLQDSGSTGSSVCRGNSAWPVRDCRSRVVRHNVLL